MKLINFFLYKLIKLLNFFVKRKNDIYFIPHYNCKTDCYDITNYSSDNVLAFLNFIFKKNVLENHTFYIEVYDERRVVLYKEYIENLNINITCIFIKIHLGQGLGFHYIKSGLFIDLVKAYWHFMHSYKCFTSTFTYDFPYKVSSQTIICMLYYTPFKNDYFTNKDAFDLQRHRARRSFDFCISTSAISSRIVSIDSGISYDKFVPLGFPRNDTLLSNNKIGITKFIKSLKLEVNKIITYAPTFRDYESSVGFEFPLLKYLSSDICDLVDVLECNKAILFLKLHPLQYRFLDKVKLPSRIVLTYPSYDYNLYDLLSISDFLITDYGSVYFDFLLLNRPILFYFYDIDRYKKERGFSYDPIESFCAGPISYSFNSLTLQIEYALTGGDKFESKRKFISSLMNKNLDANSAERVYSFFFKK